MCRIFYVFIFCLAALVSNISYADSHANKSNIKKEKECVFTESVELNIKIEKYEHDMEKALMIFDGELEKLKSLLQQNKAEFNIRRINYDVRAQNSTRLSYSGSGIKIWKVSGNVSVGMSDSAQARAIMPKLDKDGISASMSVRGNKPHHCNK